MECTSIQIKSMKQVLQSTTMSDTVDLLYFNKSSLTTYGILTMRLSMTEHVWMFHDGRSVYAVFSGVLATFITAVSAMSDLTLTNGECENRHEPKTEDCR